MLRILSWNPGFACDKVQTPDFDALTPKQSQPIIPRTDFSLSNSMKRKRSPSCDMQSTGPVERVATTTPFNQGDSDHAQPDRVEPVQTEPTQTPSSHTDLSLPTPPFSMADSHSADMTIQKTSEKRLRHMRQTISSQLSLEILLKHKELRLIDQEIAKCQVALEQLRRCSEIPYPGSQSPSILVSEGKGAALRKAGAVHPAPSPAPWGVTDGPYSRHYAKWLLPDPRFDGGQPEPSNLQDIMDAAVPARSTRGSFVESGKSLKSRSTIRSTNFQSLPAGYGQPKEKFTGPMILKRKSDNVMVKLVCPDCTRHDFGSAQGFINHCRIGHGRSFASHDAAAEACGEPVEYNDNGSIKGVEPVASPITGNMHPLIRSAKLLPHPSVNTPISTKASEPEPQRKAMVQPSSAAPDFTPSSQVPHLSALIQSQGLGLNVQDLVTDAKTKIELAESDHEDEEMDIDSPLPTNGGRHPQVAGSKQPTKSTSSNYRSPLLHSSMRFDHNRPEPNSQQQRHHLAMSIERSEADFAHPLIPSPTNESTQAPSLVDDDEEFDPQSPPSSDEVDDVEVDFDIQDDEHSAHTALQGGELPSPQTTCVPASPARTHHRRTSAVRRSQCSKGEDKNVTFASPSPHPEGSDQKRRKLEDQSR